MRVPWWLPIAALVGCADPPDPVDREPPGVDTEPPVPVPGSPTLQRHTTTWLVHATTDLLGLAPDVAALPADPATEGYDAVASGLALTPALFVAWRDAVQDLTTRLTVPRQLDLRYTPRSSATVTGARVRDGQWTFRREGRIELSFFAPSPGRYALHFERDIGWRLGLPDETPLVETWVGNERQIDAEVTDGQSGLTAQELVAFDHFEAGWQSVWLEFPADVPEAPDVVVLELAVTGPDDPVPLPARDALFACEPGTDARKADWVACAEAILVPLARRAWRDPDAGLHPWLDDAVADVRAHDEPFSEVVRLGLDRILLSPRFLLRHEAGSQADDALAGPELAGRLARFLWASVPDEALLDRAASGALSDPAALAAELHRMLADPRAARLLDDFAGQWLGFGRLHRVRLDPMRYPELDDHLRAAMRAELQALVHDVWADDRPVTELLTATTAHVEAPLHEVYGLPAPGDVHVGALGRRGVLGAAGTHAITSMPGRTSPTVRGAWVLDRLLCDPPGDPPANVPSLPEGEDVRNAAEAHATNPACAGCHTKMDPLGLALEAFDPIGRFRLAYPDGTAIDPLGRLPDGTEVDGAVDLAELVAGDPRFPRCAARELLTYALGRVLSDDDDAIVDRVTAAYQGEGGTLGALITAVATDPVFGRLEGAR